MTDGILTADQIITAAQDVLRRYGPAKATVVDVARALGVSHGSVYRHFPSKAALREAVTQRWLEQSHTTVDAVMATGADAQAKLRGWLAALFAAKRKKAFDDPELFATYMVLVAESSAVIERHVAGLIDQIAEILTEGVAQGVFAVDDIPLTARAVLQATSHFHDPVYASEWGRPGVEQSFDAVWTLVSRGLAAQP